ncbi:MAG: LEPR-XLL domain-containing protein [Candidatus Competibacteraceae bacterium]|nr:LEPR-XLL domain-containing protein [Candidatus Competibacteraceae bacterium]
MRPRWSLRTRPVRWRSWARWKVSAHRVGGHPRRRGRRMVLAGGMAMEALEPRLLLAAVPLDATVLRVEAESFVGSSAWQTLTDSGTTYRVVPNGTGIENQATPTRQPGLSTS